MDHPTLIGLIGSKGSGKDTCADYLVEKFHYHKVAFGDPVKEICKLLFNLSNDRLENRHLKEQIDPHWNISPRNMFQRIGTEFGQELVFTIFPELNDKIDKKHLWITLLSEKMGKLNGNDYNLKINHVISDIRFKHEVDFIKQRGGQVLKINRPNLKMNDIHKSENELDTIDASLIDYEIDNNYSLEELYSQLDTIINLSTIKKKN
jgi:hypothetical protein